jgi:DNA-binding response OmpR family regulator/anti-sigma regulatory factor (Ser/Thr protein kinase)
VVLLLITYFIAKYYTERIKLRNSLYYEKKLRQQETALNKERFRFFTSFSHELRTPLTLILGPVKDILNQENNPDTKRKLSLIDRNAKVLLELISKMLEFRKTETEHNHLVVGLYNFNDFVTEIYENFSFYAKEKEIEFKINIESHFEIWFDYKKILIVINNLLSNAFKYTKKGGIIGITIFEDGDTIMLQISDSGSGIREEEITSIFNLYYHSEDEERTEGTGIGLALCKKLMDLHQGNISVESKLGEGTIFTVELNKTKAHYEKIKNIEFVESKTFNIKKPFIKELDPIPVTNERIEFTDDDLVLLIVDDNVDVVDYVSDIMSKQYKVITANDGQEGIDKAMEVIPDLIISDIMMPEKSGIDLCFELKNNTKTSHIPIVLLTAKFGIDDKLEATKIGADDYISKPFDSEYLISRIENLFKNRERLVQHFNFESTSGPELKPQTVEDIFLERLNNSIIENYNGKDVSIPELASILGFSRSSLYRKIKAVTGLPINHYVRNIRLDNVAKLISENHLNVSEAAYQMGFNDLKYFRVCFKEQFGVSASEYKKQKSTTSKLDS